MDTISNLLTIIRNGCISKKDNVTAPFSKQSQQILELLKREGYIANYENTNVNNHPYIKIKIGYDERRKPIINSLIRISRPGRRVYVKQDSITLVRRGLGTAIISTSRGLMTDREALKNKIGGELICKIW